MMIKKIYDLEERTYLFAKNCRLLIKSLPKTLLNIEDGKQLIRFSGSIETNDIEANEKLGDKDFKFILKISRKEAKESLYWLRLLKNMNESLEEPFKNLIQERQELRKILTSILIKP